MNRIIRVLTVFTLSAILISCGGEKSNSEKTTAVKETTSNIQEKQEVQQSDFNIDLILEAAFNGNIASIEKAINEGFDVNTIDQERHSALMLAAYNGHSAVVKLLLDNGAKPDMKDLMDRTALMYGSTGDFNETVELLLKSGASINLVDNEEHFTALMFAAAEGQTEVVKTLLKNGADKSLLDIDKESAYDFALANGHTEVATLLK